MPKSKEQKKQILDNLLDKINRAKSVIFAQFDKLPVKENEDLRLKLKKEDSEYYVAKKTLFDLAFKNSKINGLEIKDFVGQIAAIFAYGDEISPAKIVYQFKKDKEGKIEFIGGVLENKFIDKEEVLALAQLPSRHELYTKLVWSINAPVAGLVNVLAANLRNFTYVLKAISEKNNN